MKSVKLVLDLQFGSTGKGLIVGYLAETHAPDTIMTAWAPNAGHTYIDTKGRKFVHTHLANGIVSKYCRRVLLGPGSLIDPDQLLAEINECSDIIAEKNIRIAIHPNAAIVTQRHRDEEAGPMTKIGSTKKGVGAAMIQRIRRDPDDINIAQNCEELAGLVVPKGEYRKLVDEASSILIEGAQGFGLSMYHGFYPYTTSRDVSTAQILADVGLPYGIAVDVIGTARTYPIRVANRYDEEARQIGWSGPHYDDQEEITFADIGQEQELTTVTKLPRRLFTFSKQQIETAVRHNGVTKVFLNFANYVKSEAELVRIVTDIESTGATVSYMGLGPSYQDVVDLDYYSMATRREHLIRKWRDHVTG